MTVRRLTSYLLLVLVVYFTSSCYKEQKESVSAPTNSPSKPRATPINGFVIQPSSIKKAINATGSLIAYEAVEIRSERAGKLVSLNFREASQVNKGKILGQIDDAELQAQRKRLLVNLDLAEKEVARGKELLKIQGISKEEIDRLENRVADIYAEIAIIDVQISKSTIKTPFSGMLGLRMVSQGAYITPSDAIVTLQKVSPIKLEFDVPEKFLSEVKNGQEITFTVVGTNKIFTGTVYAIDPEISPTTRTFRVRANAPNKNKLLKPGQFAKVNLVTGINNEAIIIPTDAVIPVLDGKQVYVVNKGRAIAKSVKTGDRRASEIEIIDGLSIGDTIIVSGLLAISDGSLITVNELVDTQKLKE